MTRSQGSFQSQYAKYFPVQFIKNVTRHFVSTYLFFNLQVPMHKLNRYKIFSKVGSQ